MRRWETAGKRLAGVVSGLNRDARDLSHRGEYARQRASACECHDVPPSSAKGGAHDPHIVEGVSPGGCGGRRKRTSQYTRAFIFSSKRARRHRGGGKTANSCGARACSKERSVILHRKRASGAGPTWRQLEVLGTDLSRRVCVRGGRVSDLVGARDRTTPVFSVHRTADGRTPSSTTRCGTNHEFETPRSSRHRAGVRRVNVHLCRNVLVYFEAAV